MFHTENHVWIKSEKRGSFISSFLISMPFLFLVLFTMAWISTTIWDKNDESGVLALFHYALNCFLPPVHMLKPLPPMGLYLEIGSLGVIKVKGHHKDGALIWQNYGLIRRKRSLFTFCLSLPWKMRKCPTASHDGSSHQKPNMLEFQSQTYKLQNNKKTNFCCLSHPVLDFVKCFCVNWYDYKSFFSSFCSYDGFSNIALVWYTWSKFHFVMLYNSFYTLSESAYWYFGEIFLCFISWNILVSSFCFFISFSYLISG